MKNGWEEPTFEVAFTAWNGEAFRTFYTADAALAFAKKVGRNVWTIYADGSTIVQTPAEFDGFWNNQPAHLISLLIDATYPDTQN